MNLVTFGLGGPKAGFLRLGFGSAARVPEQIGGGGWLKGQFRPLPEWQWPRPQPRCFDFVSVCRLRVRVLSTSVFAPAAGLDGQDVLDVLDVLAVHALAA